MDFSRNTPHVLVDGYNIIHAWPDLKAALRVGYHAACSRLVTLLQVLHDMEQVRVTVVFDGNADRVTIERPGKELTFSVIFTPAGTSADSIIEQIVCNSRGKNPVVVATNDYSIAMVARAQGQRVLSSHDLQDWLNSLEARQQRYLAKSKPTPMPRE